MPAFFAHRFGRAYGPDSSLRSLEHALAGTVDGLETDCCLTADDGIALLHDPFLHQSTTLGGWAIERPLMEILEARLRDADGRVTEEQPLALAWLLERLEYTDVTLQLEVKAFADAELALRTAERVCDVVAAGPRAAAERCEIISFWPDACALAARRGFRARAIVACPYLPDAFAAWARTEGVTGVILEAPYWSADVVRTWRDAGLSVMCGAVNDASLLARLLPLAPDAVSTDRPHELREELATLLER